MKRRHFLAGLGVAASGTAVGTGAFSSVEANRTVNIEIADEDEALLAMEPLDNQVVDDKDRGEIQLDFDSDVGVQESRGPGSESEYAFDQLFQVQNQGTQTVYLETDFEQTYGDPEETELEFYVDQSTQFPLDGNTAVLELGTGDAAAIGVTLGISGVDPGLDNSEDFDFNATITAEDEQPEEVDEIIEVEDDGNSGGGGGG